MAVAAERDRVEGRLATLVFGVLATLGVFWIHGPALGGPFISDDHFYVPNNPYIKSLSRENLGVLFDPTGAATELTLNYAPVHLLFHAVEWQLFGTATRGYHVVNVWIQLLAAAALHLLLRRTGIAVAGAMLGTSFFLVHPANVEAVAWIFQLKTLLSTALGLLALVCLGRRNGLATALFVLALLTKISAIFALPAALALARCEGDPRPGVQAGRPARSTRATLALWLVLFLAIGVPVYRAIMATSVSEIELHPDRLVHARTVVAIGMRYLVMAATAKGVSAFQMPEPATSWLDPWWLGGLLVLSLIGVRYVTVLRARRPEAVFWTIALFAFAPVSQVVPFRYPVADHYLHPILPGLIGATLHALSPALGALDRSAWAQRARSRLPPRAQWMRLSWLVASLATTPILLLFSWHSHERAFLWTSGRAVAEDAARHYPDGLEAWMLKAHDAAGRRDATSVAHALRNAMRRGMVAFDRVRGDRHYAAVVDHPEVQAVLIAMAERRLEREALFEHPSQQQLLAFAAAYAVRGDLDAAIERLERALALGGVHEDRARRQLERLRLERRLQRRLGE